MKSNSDYASLEMDMSLFGGIAKPMTQWGPKEIKDRHTSIRGFNYFINKGSAMPERALLAAIVYRALVDLQSASHFERSDYNPRRHRREAQAFFLSDDIKSSGSTYTFIEICIYLDLDPKRIRTELRKKGLLES